MERFFYPQSIAIIGLSSKANNLPRMILENLLRWGYGGRIFGVNSRGGEGNVSGIKMYSQVEDLPSVPDLAVCLIPARLVPESLEKCGHFGVRRVAVLSGGFAELDEEGKNLSDLLLRTARAHDIRFVGPNCLATANRANGLCLPFTPACPPPQGGLSIISQSGGAGLMLWDVLANERVGMAKFASIGNRLDLNEADFLEYFGQDPETSIVCMHLESIACGSRLVRVAKEVQKPIVVYKSNTTSAGRRAALSHTASLSSDEDIIDAAFEEAGIIRVHNYGDLVAVAKAFSLPPMGGNRIMVMSPAGGFAVIGADLCEKAGFDFAHPGEAFYEDVGRFAKAGVIKFSNPFDMGDIYDPSMVAHVTYEVMHNDNVDGAVYIGAKPRMPEGENIIRDLFHTDLSKEIYGAILSSGKPLAVCLYGPSGLLSRLKEQCSYPLFNNPEEMVRALFLQKEWHRGRHSGREADRRNLYFDKEELRPWIDAHTGVIGEDALKLLSMAGIVTDASIVARDEKSAAAGATTMGYPLVMKVVSPDALHKTDAGGIMVGIRNENEVRRCFRQIRQNLQEYKEGARFEGVRIQRMADEGHDMFIGGRRDSSFGPAIVFGFGGIYVEVFKDIHTCLCPADVHVVRKKIESLKSYAILTGARGGNRTDIEGYVDAIVRVSWMLAEFPEIQEVDINPLRLFKKRSGLCALDARMVLKRDGLSRGTGSPYG